MQFLPELTLLGAGLIIFMVSLGKTNADLTRNIAIGLGAAVFGATFLSYCAEGKLFFGAYQVDLYSQVFKTLIAGAMLGVLILGKNLRGVSEKVHPEYYLCIS